MIKKDDRYPKKNSPTFSQRQHPDFSLPPRSMMGLSPTPICACGTSKIGGTPNAKTPARDPHQSRELPFPVRTTGRTTRNTPYYGPSKILFRCRSPTDDGDFYSKEVLIFMYGKKKDEMSCCCSVVGDDDFRVIFIGFNSDF